MKNIFNIILILLFSSNVNAESLTDALVAAYETNPQIKAARESLARLDEGVSSAISGWYPSISANYSTGRQRNSFGKTGWNNSKSDIRQLRIEQPIFESGKTISRTKTAKYNVKAGRADLTATEQQVLLNAIIAYMDVMRNRAVLDLSSKNYNVLEKQLKASKERFNVGEVTKTDVAQSRARLSNAKAEVIQAKGDLISVEANFERIIGHKPTILSDDDIAIKLPSSLDEFLDEAKKYNPSLVAAENRRNAADSDIYVAKSNIFPAVSLLGTIRREKGAGFIGNSDFNTDSLMLNVSIPLYQSGSEYANIRGAKNLAAQRKYELFNEKNILRENSIASWEKLQTAIATIKSRKESIKAAEIALDGVHQEQLYGARTVLDVLDAEQELFIAKVNLVRAKRDKSVALYSLLAVMGKLTAENLSLKSEIYNTEKHYNAVKYKFIGF